MSWIEAPLPPTETPRIAGKTIAVKQLYGWRGNNPHTSLECRAARLYGFESGEGPEVILDGVTNFILTESVSPLVQFVRARLLEFAAFPSSLFDDSPA